MQTGRFFDGSDIVTGDNFFITKVTVEPTHAGILDNLTFAIKDVIDIKGQKTSCGNPTWLKHQNISEQHADCVKLLLENGSQCIGKTVLGEFCTGSTGINHFYGMPPNPKAPERVPGGSSSGSASAVAAGIVDFALGTDTAGSIRLPASFCGIYGLRSSYGTISMSGVKSFSPSFDTIGIFSRTLDTLNNVFEVLAGKPKEKQAEKINNFYVLEDYLLLIPQEQREIFVRFIEDSCTALQLKPHYIKLVDIHSLANDKVLGISAIFRKLFCADIWKNVENWINDVNLKFKKDTYVDFSYMASIDRTQLDSEIIYREIYSVALRKLLSPGNILCIPSTPDVAPFRNQEYAIVNQFDYEKLRPLIALLSGFEQDYFLINAAKNITCLLNELKKNKGLKY
jgi:amidase